jgi:hypothetical protein
MNCHGLHLSNSQPWTRFRVPAARCARVVPKPSAPKRAWGMPGAQCTRSLVCEVGSSKCTRVFTAVAPEITRHPRTQWFTAYFVLSPAIGLSCHRRLRRYGLSKTRSGRHAHRKLDAGVEASGPHDFAVRFSAVRLRAQRIAHGSIKPALRSLPRAGTAASIASRPAFVTIAIRPSVGRDGESYSLIWISEKPKYFCERGWTSGKRKAN